MPLYRWSLPVVALVLLLVELAAGDGFMSPRPIEVGRSGALTDFASGKQEAVLVTDGELVQVILRTHFTAGAEEIGRAHV